MEIAFYAWKNMQSDVLGASTGDNTEREREREKTRFKTCKIVFRF